VRVRDVRRSDAGVTLSPLARAREGEGCAAMGAIDHGAARGGTRARRELLYKWEDVRGDAAGDGASYFVCL
jgi:hypothetical protein